MNNIIDSEEMGNRNELEQKLNACILIPDEMADILKGAHKRVINVTESLESFEELYSILTEQQKEIVILEQRKKSCKNYLELKQINRRLNSLKSHGGKHRNGNQ